MFEKGIGLGRVGGIKKDLLKEVGIKKQINSKSRTLLTTLEQSVRIRQ
jgi:hypothetical protein